MSCTDLWDRAHEAYLSYSDKWDTCMAKYGTIAGRTGAGGFACYTCYADPEPFSKTGVCLACLGLAIADLMAIGDAVNCWDRVDELWEIYEDRLDDYRDCTSQSSATEGFCDAEDVELAELGQLGDPDDYRSELEDLQSELEDLVDEAEDMLAEAEALEDTGSSGESDAYV